MLSPRDRLAYFVLFINKMFVLDTVCCLMGTSLRHLHYLFNKSQMCDLVLKRNWVLYQCGSNKLVVQRFTDFLLYKNVKV